MKKRSLLVLLLILLITGCTPEYNLEFKSGVINEKLIIKEIPSNYNEADFNSRLAIPEKNEYYNTSFDNNVATYQYTYDFKNISESNMINSCYDAYNFFNEDEYYVFQTSSKFTCYPLQLSDFIFARYKYLNINIKLEGYQVLENNADSINGNVYNWKINESNYNNKPIFLKFKKNLSNESEKNNSEFNSNIILLIIGVVIVIGIIILIYALNLNKKRNKL